MAAAQGHASFGPFFGRRIVVLRDITPSFARHIEEANREIVKIIKSLGPGDEVVVADVGPDFDPARSVVIQCTMPELPANIGVVPSNLIELSQKQRQLDRVWLATTQAQAKMIAYFTSKVQTRPGGTLLEPALLYAAKRLSLTEDSQKTAYLIILSDLKTEKGRTATGRPPQRAIQFNGAEIQVLLAPWDSAGWGQIESAWKNWFLLQGHAKNFRIFDTAESLIARPLPPSPAPHRLPSPFSTARKQE
jgi:hypothetical protein